MNRITHVDDGWICINPEENYCPTMSFCECCNVSVRCCPYFSKAIEKLKHYEDLEEEAEEWINYGDLNGNDM